MNTQRDYTILDPPCVRIYNRIARITPRKQTCAILDGEMVTGNPPVLRKHWPLWAEFLHRHRLENMAAWMLEVIGPLSLLGSQVFSLGCPFLRPWLTHENELAVAMLLEDREEALAFASFLREEILS